MYACRQLAQFREGRGGLYRLERRTVEGVVTAASRDTGVEEFAGWPELDLYLRLGPPGHIGWYHPGLLHRPFHQGDEIVGGLLCLAGIGHALIRPLDQPLHLCLSLLALGFLLCPTLLLGLTLSPSFLLGKPLGLGLALASGLFLGATLLLELPLPGGLFFGPALSLGFLLASCLFLLCLAPGLFLGASLLFELPLSCGLLLCLALFFGLALTPGLLLCLTPCLLLGATLLFEPALSLRLFLLLDSSLLLLFTPPGLLLGLLGTTRRLGLGGLSRFLECPGLGFRLAHGLLFGLALCFLGGQCLLGLARCCFLRLALLSLPSLGPRLRLLGTLRLVGGGLGTHQGRLDDG